MRRTIKPETDRDTNGVPRLRVRGNSGRWLAFHGEWTEPRPDRRGETIVVIEPARPQEVAWLQTRAYGLSPRERAVVDLVVRGASTKQISATLFISEYTVQEHLKHVFDNVGVRSRRELTKRFFFDNLYPTLFA